MTERRVILLEREVWVVYDLLKDGWFAVESNQMPPQNWGRDAWLWAKVLFDRLIDPEANPSEASDDSQ